MEDAAVGTKRVVFGQCAVEEARARGRIGKVELEMAVEAWGCETLEAAADFGEGCSGEGCIGLIPWGWGEEGIEDFEQKLIGELEDGHYHKQWQWHWG